MKPVCRSLRTEAVRYGCEALSITWTTQLADQLDWHWPGALRPRLDGLTDDEYFWQPVAGCWTVRTDGSVDFAYPPPQPEPFTTIA